MIRGVRSFFLLEYRCDCEKLLFKGILFTSIIELKCKRCHKVSELYGMNKQVEQKSGRYTMLFDALGGVKIIDASPSASEILGYSKKELLTMTGFDLDPLLAAGNYDHLWKTSFNEFKKGFRINSVQRKKNGDLFPIKVLVRFIISGLKVYAFTIIDSLDLHTFPLVNNHFSFSIDPDSTFTYIDPSVENILGFAQSELLGSSIFNYLAPSQVKSDRTIFENAVAKKIPILHSFDFVHKKGNVVKLDTCFLPYHDDLGYLERYEGACWK